jgi:DNA-binding Lrp family transcriptional regulator
MAAVAIPLLAVAHLHAGAFAVGVLTALSTLAFLIIGLPAGVIVDRSRQRRLLIGADLGRAVLYLDLDLATPLLGFPLTAYLWLRVEPASLVAAGTELAGHEEVPFVAAVSGPANLVAMVICRDTEALYQYVATRISAIAGVRELEVSPTLRRIKQAGSRMNGLRLIPPAAGPPPARARAARPGGS